MRWQHSILAGCILVLITPTAAAQGWEPAQAWCGSEPSRECQMRVLIIAAVWTAAVIILIVVGVTMRRMRARDGPIWPRFVAVMTGEEPPVVESLPNARQPWPDELREKGQSPREPEACAPEEQYKVANHRLFFADGSYFFSTETGQLRDWKPIAEVPRGYRVRNDSQGRPRLERDW